MSIDFDFFAFIDRDWDYGHNEYHPELFTTMIWAIRYMNSPLAKESTIKKADFPPYKLVGNLQKKGFVINKDTHLTIADKHVQAYYAFDGLGSRIINIDAHHDCWVQDELNSGNWLAEFMETRRVDQIFPNWMPKKYWDADNLPIECQYYKDFKLTEKTHVESLVLCRSSCWLPPHYDSLFFLLATELEDICTTVSKEKMKNRMDLIHDLNG